MVSGTYLSSSCPCFVGHLSLPRNSLHLKTQHGLPLLAGTRAVGRTIAIAFCTAPSSASAESSLLFEQLRCSGKDWGALQGQLAQVLADAEGAELPSGPGETFEEACAFGEVSRRLYVALRRSAAGEEVAAEDRCCVV